jgi:hypothetical protein
VLEDYDWLDDRARVFEPASGDVVNLSGAELRKTWSGEAIVFRRGAPSQLMRLSAILLVAFITTLAFCNGIPRIVAIVSKRGGAPC